MAELEASIRIEGGPHAGSTHPVRAGAAIGRAATCAVPLPDDGQVSRRHAVIEMEGGAFRLRDLQSRNGTTLNDASVDSAPLKGGDVIRVGGSRLRFEVALPARPTPRRPQEKAADRDGGRPRKGGSRGVRRRERARPRASELALFFVLLVLCYLIASTLTDVALIVVDRIRPG